MSQGFKLRYDEMRENDPTKASNASRSSGENDYYDSPGNARSLCLVWPDGKRAFFSYAYLVSGEFSLADDKNVIVLSFSSHTLTLKGYGLEPLLMALLDHLPKIIVAADTRYVLNDNLKEVLVLDILVEKKEE